jgi:cellulose synthase/poly-beta-1,6-N-acetylglucosamine synthase-like glycosyltransferase
MEFLFWLAVLLLFYTYLGYPLLLVLAHRLLARPVSRGEQGAGTVSLIIAAYNEQGAIEGKILNSLQLAYPGKLEIIVVSDGSTDGTDAIVERYRDRGVALVRVEGRRGKTAAQNHAVSVSQGDILLFSDATSIYEPDVVTQILRPFVDPRVGCVSGRLVFRTKANAVFGGEKNTSEGYDQWIKALESDIHSIYGVNGCLYALRRECYRPLADTLTSDFVVPLMILESGLRVVFEPRAVCYEEPCAVARGEFNRKIRTSRAGIAGMIHMRRLLNPFRYFWPCLGLMSHKVLRWMSPFLLATALASNLFLAGRGLWYQGTLAAQCCFYLCCLIGYFAERRPNKQRIFTVPFNFMLINVAAVFGLFQCLAGNISEAWETERD